MGIFIIEKILFLTTVNQFFIKQRKRLKSMEYVQDFFQDVKIIFPQTFMNHSGEAVQRGCSFYQCSPSDVVVFHDEIELPLGEIRYKFSGGHSGHNGVRDVIQKMGSADFHRIRLGVGRPTSEKNPEAKKKETPTVGDYLLETTVLEGMLNPEKVLKVLKEKSLY